jgi:hypothetical protein
MRIGNITEAQVLSAMATDMGRPLTGRRRIGIHQYGEVDPLAKDLTLPK